MDTAKAIEILRRMIAIPSPSRGESQLADFLENELIHAGMRVNRIGNNLWVKSDVFADGRPTLLLNSHIDTVKPSPAYTRNPYSSDVEGDKLYGLGSNDAGASGVSLLAVFDNHRHEDLGYNVVFGWTAEEEVSGENGMRAFLPHLAQQGIRIDMALVGEPTSLQAAVGERGLVVLDCVATGKQGHAARDEGDNAILKAIRDIRRLSDYRFDKRSDMLGDIKKTVTQINAGYQHNVIPAECKFVVDMRTTDAYTNEQVVQIMRDLLESDVKERSTRIRASAIEDAHPLVRTAKALGCTTFVSPTTSDMALMPFPSLKLGVGESSRSHSADEFVLISEIERGIALYDKFLKTLKLDI